MAGLCSNYTILYTTILDLILSCILFGSFVDFYTNEFSILYTLFAGDKRVDITMRFFIQTKTLGRTGRHDYKAAF